MPRHTLSCLLVAALLVGAAAAADLGEAPRLGASPRDVATAHRLPPLREGRDPVLAAELGALQVGARARALGLTPGSASHAWSDANATLQGARTRLAAPPPRTVHTFAGTTASRLNAVLADRSIGAVRVTAPVLRIDVPLTIERSDLRLDLGGTELRSLDDGPRFLVRVAGASRVALTGGVFAAGRWGVLVERARDVTLADARFQDLREGGITVTASTGTVVARSRFAGLGGAAVLLHGRTERTAVLDNEIVANRGASNWAAGIVLTDRQAAVASDPATLLQADRYWAREQPIRDRLQAPRRNVVAQNRIAANASSGLYVDGAIENVIVDNVIEGNSKEGVCLDYGATANVLASNAIRLNGKRWGKSDEELKLDFVGGDGRLADGTPPAKTPGISLDNALYNVVYANRIDRNFGGGVKAVRATWFNLIGLNTVTDNNEGASERFHFFGIELGAAQADAASDELDFAPSRGNLVFGNMVQGGHHAGIFLGAGSTQNDVFDNTILGARAWAIEQPLPQANATLNNLTNLPSRHIDAGLDAKLLELSKGRAE